MPADETHQGPLAKVSQALGEVFVAALAERSEPQECKKGDHALKEQQMPRTWCRFPTDALALLQSFPTVLDSWASCAAALVVLAAGLFVVIVYARAHILNLARMPSKYLRWLKC